MSNPVTIDGTASPARQLNLRGVLDIPAVRQVLLLVGVAAAVAAGFAIVLWSQVPDYARLYGNLETGDAAQVAEALRAAGIEPRIDTVTGAVSVPASQLHDARLELASQELPKGGSVGMEMLGEQSGFGVSQFMESARYQHALEAELARTISHLGAVESARVHLAMPRQTSFIRDQRQASASVLLELHRGGALEPGQASAIVHLVATSVPNLDTSRVTLIDQHGRLLSATGEEQGRRTTESFERARQLEAMYRRRIEDLLTPLVGTGRVRAQVVADLDFTITERTRESFDPAKTALRSEQLSIERQDPAASPPAVGIPGAISNQPPAAGGVAPGAAGAGDPSTAGEPVEISRESTRNFEVDRTISHTRPESGTIERLSVAVLVDDSPPEGEAAAEYEPLTDADIERFTALVREAVGFRAERGDSVVVVKAEFRDVPEPGATPEPALWEQPLARDVLKQVLGALLVLAIAFGVVRPMLRGLVTGNAGASSLRIAQGAASGGGTVRLPGAPAALEGPSFDEKIAAARNITGHDPARVAQVVKKWVSTDGS